MGPRRTRRMGSPAAARESAVTISPDQHRGPQRSELEAIRDANANTPQRDDYADDPNVREPSEDDRDAKAVLAVALELPTPSLDRSNLPDPDATTADVCDLCKKPAGHLSPVSGAGFRACVSCYTKDPAACTWCKERPSALWEAPSGDVLCDTCRETYAKGYVLLAASTIRPEEVEWYYEGRVPLGSLTLLVGQAGLGKTMFACELSARGSRGQLGSPAAAVIFATAEDSLAHTLVPRLTAAGADLARVRFMKIVDDGLEGLTLPEDIDKLQDAVETTGAKLIVLDPEAICPATLTRTKTIPLGGLSRRLLRSPRAQGQPFSASGTSTSPIRPTC